MSTLTFLFRQNVQNKKQKMSMPRFKIASSRFFRAATRLCLIYLSSPRHGGLINRSTLIEIWPLTISKWSSHLWTWVLLSGVFKRGFIGILLNCALTSSSYFITVGFIINRVTWSVRRAIGFKISSKRTGV